MEYGEAKRYCNMLLICRKAIQKSIDTHRKKQNKQQVEMLRKLYTKFDPHEDQLTKIDKQPIPFVKVRWGKSDDTFILERPELWIKTFVQALGIYKSIVGQVKYNWIIYIYSRGSKIDNIASRYGVTRATVYKEIDRLKYILLVVAVQNGLVTIEKNQSVEADED